MSKLLCVSQMTPYIVHCFWPEPFGTHPYCLSDCDTGLCVSYRVQLLQGAALPVAVCAGSLCARWGSSHGGHKSGQYQRSHGPNWRHALAGLLAGTGAVLAYGLHHSQVRGAVCVLIAGVMEVVVHLCYYTVGEI